MREKELRIALVCFGGVSLAVYMHGITKEILKLVRASAALHGISNRTQRDHAAFSGSTTAIDMEADTEPVYFELLQRIGSKLELRVIVDIIAGASAGGINGTMLARALSHDLQFGAIRDLWLDNADVTVLLAPDARAGAFGKWFLKPFIWIAAKTGLLGSVEDAEVRAKLSLFLRSRWFKPPLDGKIMAGLMYDAVKSMGSPRPGASLIPTGLSLDLFVTLTDYHGYHQLIQIHDPPLIRELEHHHALHFVYRRRSDGTVRSDFDDQNAAALAFAARATSSYPGAFPPALIAEMDDLVARRGDDWLYRNEFITHNFYAHVQAGVDPQTVVFIDGAILNNRPFQQAISAIHGRPAYRQVDRRLVYIDPHPPEGAMRGPRQVPGFFSTLRGAISDIPSSQPVIDELGWVAQFNDQVRRLRDIVESARPHVRDLVGGVVPDKIEGAVTAAELRAWREQVNDHVARDAGFAYEAYVRLKLASARAAIAETIVKLRGVPVQSPLTRVVGEIVDVWAARKHLKYERNDGAAPQAASAGRLPGWVAFLLAFDVNYRERRLHFLIEGQNRLYQFLDFESFGDLDPLVVDRLKREFYRRLDALRLRESASFYSATTRAMVTDIFPSVPAPSEMRDIEHFANDFVDRHGPAIDRLIDALAAEIDLDATTHELDELLAELDPQAWHAAARREVLVNYLGFPFWDVLTFPVTSAREMGEFNEILVDRISPLEAHALEGFNGVESLKGIGFGHFAAFLSRAYRENDYLLGRLHALDRLIDIVCDSAGDAALAGIDAGALKRRGFAMILTAEESTLTHCAELIAALRRFIGEQSAAGDGPTFN